MKEIAELGRKADPDSIRVLMSLGDEQTYLNWAAVEALGYCRGREVEMYLERKLSDPNVRVLIRAVRSYAQVMDKRAAPKLIDVLIQNRIRSDGMEESVAIEAAKALGSIGTPEAVTALLEELDRTSQGERRLEFGSVLVGMMPLNGGERIRIALNEYATRLETRHPSNPKVKEYIASKVAEARRAAANVQPTMIGGGR
jgi:hypothetical protein